METILDECYEVEVERVDYRSVGILRIVLIELVRSETPEDVPVTEKVTFENSFAIRSTAKSRHFLVEFNNAIFHQVLNESYASQNKDERRDTKGFIQKITKSNYQEYIKTNFGWYEQVIGKGIHYRIRGISEIIDVISCEDPEIMEIDKN